ncbi:MAG: class I SAM-dependent methyltransferase [Chlamydiales bacterium]|nr:class I SAM-dependent methyltransferase [Chlamydiales bacterium]
MKKRIAFACALLLSATLVAAPKAGHTSQGTSYGQHEYKGHGPDGELFLDPYLESELKNVMGNVVLDAGCGAAPWAVAAAQSGAVVCGVDIQQTMLDKAQLAVARAGVERQVELCQGDVTNLPYEAQKFDYALSVNVGCNLQRTMQTISSEQFAVSGLGAHFHEVGRVLKEGGRLLVSAPASLGVLFTDGNQPENAVMEHIRSVLAQIGSSRDPDVIIANLKQLEEVQRATFVHRDNKLVLVTDEKDLRAGEPIWRKIPESAVLNYYHSEEEYLVAFHNAGLKCEEIKRPCFFGTVKYRAYRAEKDELGEAYVNNHPFTIYYVTKPGERL